MAALVLVGCTPDAPTETTPPASTEASPPPSVPAVVGEATSTYENFLNARSELTQSPEADVDDLRRFATDSQASTTYAEVLELVQSGQSLEGRFTVTTSTLVSESDQTPSLILCVDNSEVVIVDRATGDTTSTTPADPVLVTFSREDTLKVDEVGEVPADEAVSCD